MEQINSKDSNCTTKFFKKRRIVNTRQRKQSSSDNDDNSEGNESVVVHKDPRKQKNPNIQKTRKLQEKTKIISSSDSSSGCETVSTSVNTVNYTSTGKNASNLPKDMGATRTYEFDTEFNKDAQAIFERSAQVNKELKGETDDKIYRGINNYAKYIEKKDSALGNASSGLVRKGPVRAPANIRSTVRWDYQPDTCKDYKETGYCGFGDSCKFAHDRGDYKAGWQLEQEEKEGATNQDDRDYAISSDDDDLPFKCYLCRKSFVSPVITKCKHYFCERCALQQYRKSKRCFVCGQQTFGVFNPAKDLISKIKAKKIKRNKKEKNEDSSNYDSTSDKEVTEFTNEPENDASNSDTD